MTNAITKKVPSVGGYVELTQLPRPPCPSLVLPRPCLRWECSGLVVRQSGVSPWVNAASASTARHWLGVLTMVLNCGKSRIPLRHYLMRIENALKR